MSDSSSSDSGSHGVEQRDIDVLLEAELIATLEREIASNLLMLPSLPDVALRVREVLADPDCSTARLAQAVSSDAGMAARLIKVTNSAAYRGMKPVDDLKSAITRLGLQLVRTLVTQLALLQSMHAYSPAISRELQRITDHSLDVAARCHTLAVRYTRLQPEEALLAGLLHDIGKLPLITRMEQLLGPRMATLPTAAIVERLHPRVGGMVLRSWQFAPELVTAVEEHHRLQRRPHDRIDYADLVIAANLLHHLWCGHDVDAEQAHVFRKLGTTPQQLLEDTELEMQRTATRERLRL